MNELIEDYVKNLIMERVDNVLRSNNDKLIEAIKDSIFKNLVGQTDYWGNYKAASKDQIRQFIQDLFKEAMAKIITENLNITVGPKV